MANEITVSGLLKILKGNHTESQNTGSIRFDQTTQGAFSSVVDVGTSIEEVTFGDIALANVGWTFVRNLDVTNYVDIGPTTDSATTIQEFARLEAGEFALFRMFPSIEGFAARANIASCKVKFMVLKD